ncbi:MAG: signal transduction protein [uncultured bacterium (gcode 4)]|uniref:Signal transduction protein n=1 Tax=uncultured bacterium (gcode 4) TaxID=1234023 RepID=K2FXW9_9BACT|nr:MAG: signal transduction protein [uncultured bacterium (gcode 4)]
MKKSAEIENNQDEILSSNEECSVDKINRITSEWINSTLLKWCELSVSSFILIRHWRTKSEVSWNKSKKDEPLTKVWKNDDLEEAIWLIKKIKYQENIIYYSSWTRRVNESLYIILSKSLYNSGALLEFSEENFKALIAKVQDEYKNIKIIDDTRFETSEDNNNSLSTRIQWQIRVMKETIDWIVCIENQILSWLNRDKNIIVIGHKSNKPWVLKAIYLADVPWIDPWSKMEPWSIIEVNINDEGRFLWNYYDIANGKQYRSHPRVLSINHKNNDEIIKLFNFWKFIEIIEEVKIWKIKLLELQNQINNYFHTHPELLSQFLLNKAIINHDIHVFCISNLLERNEIESIKSFLGRDLAKTKQEWVEIIKLLKKYWTNNDSLIFQIYFKARTQEIIISETDLWINQNEINALETKFNLAKKIVEQSLGNINDVFDNSLDSLVNNHDLIERWLLTYERKNEEEIRAFEVEGRTNWYHLDEVEKYNKRAISSKDIALSEKWVFALLGNVWEWKSTYLADFANRMNKELNCISLFYSSKQIWKCKESWELISRIEDEINIIKETYSWNIILIFDWIDELNREIRTDMINYITKKDNSKGNINSVKVIIGSRKSWFEEFWTNEYQIICFETINETTRNIFLKSRLISLNINEDEIEWKIVEIEWFLEWAVLDEELKNTPLILFFLCKLSHDNKLQNIKNRASLYEEISIKNLEDHQAEKGLWLRWNEHDINLILDTLSFCAYSKFANGWLEENVIKQYLEKKIDYRDPQKKKNAIDSVLDQIYLLYKINNWEYSFILKSFEEYFLARHLASERNWNEEIFKVRDEKAWETNWNEWRNFKPVVLFYWEILGNSWKEEDLKKLEELLGEKWLLEKDDIFGEGFFMGLEILFYISKWAKYGNTHRLIDEYLTIIDNWESEDCIEKLLLFEKFQKNIEYQDNIFVDRFWFKLKLNDSFDFWNNNILLNNKLFCWWFLKNIDENLNNQTNSNSLVLSLLKSIKEDKKILKHWQVQIEKIIINYMNILIKKRRVLEAEKIFSNAIDLIAFKKDISKYLNKFNTKSKDKKQVKIYLNYLTKNREECFDISHVQWVINDIINQNDFLLIEEALNELFQKKDYVIISVFLWELIKNDKFVEFVLIKIDLLIQNDFFDINNLLFFLRKNRGDFEEFINAKIDFLKKKNKFCINWKDVSKYNSEDKQFYLEEAEYIIQNLQYLNSNDIFNVRMLILNLIKDNVYIKEDLIKTWINYLITHNKKSVLYDIIKHLIIFSDLNYKDLISEFTNSYIDTSLELRDILIENNLYFNEYDIAILLNQINAEEDILKLRKYKIEKILLSIFKSWNQININIAKEFIEKCLHWHKQNLIEARLNSVLEFIKLLLEFSHDQIDYIFYLLNKKQIQESLSQCSIAVSHESSVDIKIIKWLLSYPIDERIKVFIKYIFNEKIKHNNVIAIRNLLNTIEVVYCDFLDLIDVGVKFLSERDSAWLISMPKVYLQNLGLSNELKDCYTNKTQTLKNLHSRWDKRIIDSTDAVNLLLHWLISNNQFIVDICKLVKKWIIYNCNQLFIVLAIKYSLINYNFYTENYWLIIGPLYSFNNKIERWGEKIIFKKVSRSNFLTQQTLYYF